jgi:adhesin HecA-like repeat protein
MTLTEAILLLRNSDLADLAGPRLQELHDTLDSHPSILDFEGCTDAIERVAAEQRRRHPGNPAETRDHPQPDTTRRRRLATFAPLAAAAVAALLLGAWLLKPRADNLAPPPTPAAAPAAQPAISESSQPPTEQPPDAPAADLAVAPVETAAEPTPDPETAAAPPAVEAFPDMEVSGAGANLTADPDGGFRLSAINGPDLVKLSGKASRLVLNDINGEPVVDLRDLATPQVEFSGLINGSPQITVASNAGAVAFRQAINGSPRLSINCPNGTVEFREAVGGSTHLTIEAPHGRVHFHSPVHAGAHLTITAREVDFSAGLDGGATADLTLTSGGSLDYGRLKGSSSLSHRKADPADPPPAIHGDPSGTGRLTEHPLRLGGKPE